MDSLDKSIDKDQSRKKTGIKHSNAYHRFFEGYTEVIVTDPHENISRIKRIYTANYFRQNLSKWQRIFLKFFYFLILIVVIYLFISSAILPTGSNFALYVTLPVAFCVPFLFWLCISFSNYLLAKRDMTIREFRDSSKALLRSSLGTAICFGILSFAALVYLVFNQWGESWIEIISLGNYILCGVLVFLINFTEKKISCLDIPNKNSNLSTCNDEIY